VCAVFKNNSDFADSSGVFSVMTWTNANHITYPASIGPDWIFVKARFSKSMIIVVDTVGTIAASAKFPMGAGERRRILELLKR
jgi:hypothetical protein